MQLLLLALMLMLNGKNANINEIEPLIANFSGGDMAKTLKQAEELSGIMSAIGSLSRKESPKSVNLSEKAADSEKIGGGYPLAPVALVADERITYALSRYISSQI